MTQAKVEISGEEKGALAMVQALVAGFDKLDKTIAKSQESSNKAAKAAEESFGAVQRIGGSAVREIASLAAGWLSVSSAISLATSELRRHEEQNKRAANAALGAAEGQRQTVMAFGGDSSIKNVEELNAKAETMAKREGIPLGKLYQVLPSALSAKGPRTNQQALDAAGAAVALAPNAPAQEMNLLTGAAFDLMGAAGASPQQAIGAVITGQQTSRVTNPADYSRNVVPGVMQLVGMGYTLQEAIALTSSVTSATGDASGAMSATAAVQFGLQVKKNTASLPGMQNAPLKQRLNALQTTPEGKRVLSQMSGALGSEIRAGTDAKTGGLTAEAKSMTSLLQILENKGVAAELFTSNLGKVPELGQMGGVYDAKKAELSGLELQQMARSEEKSAEAVMRWQLKGKYKWSGVAAERFDQLLGNLPGSDSTSEYMSANAAWYTSRMPTWLGGSGQSDAQNGADIFRAGQRGMLFRGGEQYRTPEQLSQTEREKYDALGEAAELMLETAKLQAANAEKQYAPQPNGTPPLTSGVK